MGAVKFGITKAPKYGRAVANWVKGKLSKKSDTIKSVPIGKNLSTKRALQDKVVKAVDEGTKKGLGGIPPSQRLKQSMSKTKRDSSKSMKDISYKYDEIVSNRKKYNRRLKQKTFGGASAAIAGTVGAHSAAKKKFPKYKKIMESDVTIKDGKLGLKPKQKK